MSERTYWELCNLSFVNWYMFTAEDIPVRGRIALTGPNGSGKSSILDAMQTVHTGRSGKHLQLNSLVQTTDRSARRTVRDYILGTLDDVDDVTVVRQQAVTYLMLGYRRTGSDPKEVTIGLCMSARADADDEEVIARFIVEGRILRCSDVAEIGKDARGRWSEAKPWADVAAALRSDPSVTLQTEGGPEVFVKAVCKAIGPRHGSIDSQKFLRNLRNAAAFKPVGNTTEFVRNFILDNQPLNLSVLRESIARFKAIQGRISELKRRIEEASDLAARGEKVRGRQRTLLNHRLSVAQGRIRLAALSAASAGEERGATVRGLESLSSEIPRLETSEAAAEVSYEDSLRSAAGNEAITAAKAAERDAKLNVAEAAAARAALGPADRIGSEIGPCAILVAAFNPKLAKVMEALAKKKGEPAAVAAELPGSEFAGNLTAAAEAMAVSASAAEVYIARSTELLSELKGNLDRVQSGKRFLSGGTQKLMTLLEDAGISSAPVCDLVESVDTAWRRSVEAILGGSREALVVDPKRYEAAIKVYRQSDADGASLVNTTKSKGTREARTGTLATVIETSDPHARAFLDFRLGSIVMVKTEAELRREDSAATVDLMYASGRTLRRLSAPRHLILGAASDASLAETLEEDIAGEKQALGQQRKRLEQLRSALRVITRLSEDIAHLNPDQIRASLAAAVSGEAAAIRLTNEAVKLRKSGDGSLAAAVDDARALLVAARLATASRREERSKLDERLRAQDSQISKADTAERELRAAARVLIDTSKPLMTYEEVNEAEWWLNAPVPEAPELRNALADPEAGDAGGSSPGETLPTKLSYIEYNLIPYHSRRLENERPNFVMQVGRYTNSYGLEAPPFLSETAADAELRFLEAAAWVDAERGTLEGMILKDYEEKASEAHQDAIQHFKNDFVGKMRGAFETIRGRLRELNRQLAKRDFHGLTYRFAAKPSHAHKDMIDLIESAEREDFQISQDGTPGGDGAARALRRLEEVALDPSADIADLEDPRRYFEFDIDMDKDGVARTTMSKRLGTGSGGQVQVPFYVAICAALASTYYPDRAGLDGGMALAVFDEAFNRMDTAVIGEVMGFMDDVGLQPFIAAPDKERGTFMQFVDTIIGISRSGAAVTLDVQHMKPRAHQEFRAQNPHLIGLAAYTKKTSQGAKAAE